MSTFIGGQLVKMYIEAYPNNSFDTNEKIMVDDKNRFNLMVNPETIKRKTSINYADNSNLNTDQGGRQVSNNAEDFNISILLDTTGVIKDAELISFAITNPFSNEEIDDVSKLVVQLFRFCCEIDGDTHRSHFIKICWGSDSGLFKGVVKNFDVNYKLFRPDGKPIRAVVDLSLQSTISPEDFVKQIGFQSPDITHQRVFKAGQHFTLLSNSIYKNLNYYTDVAKANKMLSFRRIKQGEEIFFPPLK